MLTTVALFSANPVTRRGLADAANRAGLAVIELDADPMSLVAVAGSTVAVRGPGGLVGAAMALGADISVHGPTAEWFVALSTEITGRTWQRLNVAQARSLVERGPAFVKLADAKTSALPAKRYMTVSDFDGCIAGLGGSDDLQLLGTTGWLDIDSEYRVFTRERRALACSPYLIHDEPWSDLLHTHRAWFHDEAGAFAADVLEQVPGKDVPPAAALDVARLHNGRYVLLEANQSWAAAIRLHPRRGARSRAGRQRPQQRPAMAMDTGHLSFLAASRLTNARTCRRQRVLSCRIGLVARPIAQCSAGSSTAPIDGPRGFAGPICCVSVASATYHCTPHTISIMRLLSVGYATAVITAAVLTQPASAQAATPATRTATLGSVSCPSATFCAAVGSYATPQDDAADKTAVLTQIWNGKNWRNVRMPKPAHASPTEPQSEVKGVSCTSAKFCLAVADYTPENVDARKTYSTRWDGTSWHIVSTKTGSSTLPDLAAVDCASQTACVAIGQAGAGVGHPIARGWDGRGWFAISLPEVWTSRNVHLAAVSCPSQNWCTVVGWYFGASGAFRPFAATWHSGTWTQRAIANPVVAGAKKWNRNLLLDVSCVSQQRCIAVGTQGSGLNAGTTKPLLEHWNGSRWRQQATSSALEASEFSSVSCSASTHCAAVAQPLAAGDTQNSYILNGSTWHTEPMPAPKTNSVTDVDCASARECFAVGKHWAPTNTSHTLIEHRGKAWHTMATP